MAKILKKGKRGAAKAYMTRSSAIKKLQCSLADFRRLCILKGIFPRVPRHKKRANKGSTAPTSFYYAKDIAYLAHEPVLNKLREHKAFAKKLSRALGRGEWAGAKSLEDHKPTYRLDHVIKERYPTFIDALRDIDDALCLITLFASLPSNPRIPPALIESCARLSSEWQLYVMHTRSLRKVFLSIKGVYYQAEVMGQTITWLVPYMFTQAIPTDVDIRVMLTFLELYQTLLGFVFFKLYTDAELVYPPPLDIAKDEEAAGVGAYRLQEAVKPGQEEKTEPVKTTVEVDGKVVKGRDVRKQIKALAAVSLPPQDEQPTASTSTAAPAATDAMDEDEFVEQPSTSNPTGDSSSLPTLHTITHLPPSTRTNLFAPFVFYLAPGSPRPLLEFTLRSFGGRVGWPASMGSGSPFEEDDPSITHVIIDRPLPSSSSSSKASDELRRNRKYVQPQWVVDSINAQRPVLEASYAQGATLPPHLSPFGEGEGAYIPVEQREGEEEEEGVVGAAGANAVEAESDSSSDEENEEEKDEEEAMEGVVEETIPSAVEAAALAPSDPELLRAAELEAERAGLDTNEFEATLKKAVKKVKKQQKSTADAGLSIKDTKSGEGKEESSKEMNKMLMSNKQRKLYEKMKYGERKKAAERDTLEARRLALHKSKQKAVKTAAGKTAGGK